MNKVVRLDPPQIVQSAQVWECTSCGSRDNKSCSCNSTAIMVKLMEKAEKYAAKAERHRVAERDRQRASRQRPVETTKEKPKPTTSVTFYRDPLSDEQDEGISSEFEQHITKLIKRQRKRVADLERLLGKPTA